jgi:hypothetical protein
MVAAQPGLRVHLSVGAPDLAKQETRARLLWDDTNLYIAYEVEDTDIGAQFTERDAP